MTEERAHNDQQTGPDPFAAPAPPDQAPGAAAVPPYAAPPTPAAAVAPPAPTASAAGWYADPWDSTQLRYWDGVQWRTGTAPAPAPAPQQSKRRRLSRGAIAGIVAGAVALVGGGIGAVALLLPRLEDAAVSALNDSPDARVLETRTTAGWTTLPVMGGNGTVAYDPGWEDISNVMGVDDLESTMQADSAFDITMHGAWLMSGDLVNGGPTIVIVSADDVGGPSSPRIEAQSFMTGVRMDIEGIVTTSEGAIRTSEGHSGYVIEYDAPLYGEIWPNAVGVVVDGSSQLLVYSNGDLTSGSGVESVEAVLNSLEFD